MNTRYTTLSAPMYNMPQMNTVNNNIKNNRDLMSELIKLFLIKKLFDIDKKKYQNNQSLLLQYQMSLMPIQALVYKQSKSKKRSNRDKYGFKSFLLIFLF